MKEHQTWREYLIERFTVNKEEAIGYLDAALKEYQTDGTAHLFVLALWTVVESQGGVVELAKKTGKKPQFFSDVLSKDEIPRLDTLKTLLTVLGSRLSIVPLETENANFELAPEEAALVSSEDADSRLERITQSSDLS